MQTLAVLLRNNTATAFSGLYSKGKLAESKVAQTGNMQSLLCRTGVQYGTDDSLCNQRSQLNEAVPLGKA